jgi:hypothetical protein
VFRTEFSCVRSRQASSRRIGSKEGSRARRGTGRSRRGSGGERVCGSGDEARRRKAAYPTNRRGRLNLLLPGAVPILMWGIATRSRAEDYIAKVQSPQLMATRTDSLHRNRFRRFLCSRAFASRGECRGALRQPRRPSGRHLPSRSRYDRSWAPRPSRRFGLRIDHSKVLLPDIVHGAVHRAHRELIEIEQQILAER